jgi:hypothetical protein
LYSAYIKLRKKRFRCVIASILTNANLFVDGDGECAVYLLFANPSGFDDEKRYCCRYVIRRIRAVAVAVAVVAWAWVWVC